MAPGVLTPDAGTAGRRGVQHRWPVVFWAGVVLAVGLGICLGALFVSHLMLQRDAKDLLQAELKQARAVVETMLDSRYQVLTASGKAMADSPVLKALLSFFGDQPPDAATLADLLQSQVHDLGLSFAAAVDTEGRVMGWVRGEDAQLTGDDVTRLEAQFRPSDSGAVQRDLLEVSDLLYQTVSVPLRLPERQVGWLLVGASLDDAFCGRVAEATGSAVSVVAGDRIASTTLTAEDRVALAANPLATPADDAAGIPTELPSGPYLTAMLPLRDADSRLVGWLTIHQPAEGALRSVAVAGRLLAASMTVALLLTGFVSYRLARAIWQPMRLSVEDSLTGMLNRREIEHRLAAEISRADRQQHSLAVALLDLDGFKQVNDRWGHPEGDRVLRELAVFLHAELRRADQVGRLGGDEFLAVLPYTDDVRALAIAERLRVAWEREVAERMPAGPVVTISIGVAELTGPGVSAEELVLRADMALYRAKAEGRNRVCLAEEPTLA